MSLKCHYHAFNLSRPFLVVHSKNEIEKAIIPNFLNVFIIIDQCFYCIPSLPLIQYLILILHRQLYYVKKCLPEKYLIYLCS